MAYVELHARSAFSFLRGSSNPEDLVRRSLEIGLPTLALLDRDGVFGAPRHFTAARNNGLRARVGAEITMDDGTVVPLLAATRAGYQNLSRLITHTKLTPRALRQAPPGLEPDLDPQERKRPCFATWEELAEFSGGLIALTGDEAGPVRRAWREKGADAAGRALARLQNIFGRDRLHVEIQRHRLRGEEREISFLSHLATTAKLPLLATGGVTYATATVREAADVFTCLRWHTSLDAAGKKLAVNSGRHLKSEREMRALFRDYPEAVDHSVRLEAQLEFTLENLGYEFPEFPVGAGETMPGVLREQTFRAARAHFGEITTKFRERLEQELAIITKLNFCGYFLIVWDICRWAREYGILVQGRGSAANSAVCYCLGITAVNPMTHRLLFERFLTEGRVGANGRPSWPDIDLDFPSGDLREKVLQEVYARYGARGAAMTANVITYKGRSTVREIGKVLGFGDDALERYSDLYANGDFPHTLELRQQLTMAGIAPTHPRGPALVRLYQQICGLPRHLGQHSGGMIICQGRLDSVMPLEKASMPGRVVGQWDKDDCEDLGIVKVDFLGLGMMAVVQDCLELCGKRGGPSQLKDIPENDPETFARIRVADTIGVFQIESRAQMSTLPRFKPRELYDLAMQVAMIRPGPITGNLVHPLIRRRDGLEKPDYIDPSVEALVKPILERTMGVILFQEQMLELAMVLAKFSGAQAEELRRAMGFTKNVSRLDESREKLRRALQAAGHNDHVVELVTKAVTSFAAYGFPESHAISFALLAYSSTYMKVHFPAEFCASLLNNQPMGFYSPATLLQDARRHGIKALSVCAANSDWPCTVVNPTSLRLGFRCVKGVREIAVREMLSARATQPFSSMEDFLHRTRFNARERRALAAVGALNIFAEHRRAALWQVEAAWSHDESLLQTYERNAARQAPLARMSLTERRQADFIGMELTTGTHPMAGLRARLPSIVPAAQLREIASGTRVEIAGSVICRQRPGTAKGFVFISLEDETGIANAIVLPDYFERYRLMITQEPALRITGKLQNVSNVIHVKADHIAPLRAADLPEQASHDFR